MAIGPGHRYKPNDAAGRSAGESLSTSRRSESKVRNLVLRVTENAVIEEVVQVRVSGPQLRLGALSYGRRRNPCQQMDAIPP